MKEEREGRIKKDLRMQMENGERKRERERGRERERTDRESKGGRALTSKRAKRERARTERTEVARGRIRGTGMPGKEGKRQRESGTERGEGGGTRSKSGTKRPRV